MKDFFKPEDFMHITSEQFIPSDASRMANKKLNELIDSSPLVYASQTQDWQWDRTRKYLDTHTARIMFIEELPKESCKHVPAIDFYGTYWMSTPRCKICGAELIILWATK